MYPRLNSPAACLLVLCCLAAPSWAADSDSDGLDDAWELTYFEDLSQDGESDPDGDGLPNEGEETWNTNPTVVDTDGDGLSDGLELGADDTDPLSTTNPAVADTDGDGLLDGEEDRNSNGAVDADEVDPLKVDTDGDTIDDRIEVGLDVALPRDTDLDGQIDARDWDSDGDGISDLIEAGDKKIWTPPTDVDGDGFPDYADTDADGDDIPDEVEEAGDATGDGMANPDADGDGIPNRLDFDSDNDGLWDITEGVGDEDGDGIANYLDPMDPPLDGEGTGEGPGGEGPGGEGPGGEGTGEGPGGEGPGGEGTGEGPGGEGTGEGPGGEGPGEGPGGEGPGGEGTGGEGPGSGEGTGGESTGERGGGDGTVEPTDGTDIVDPPLPADGDEDQDGLLNGVELDLGTNPNNADSDGDTIPDPVEVGDPSSPTDTDGDGWLDALDLDSDADAIPDIVEAGEDGSSPRDTDADGVPDYRDLDSDDDTVSDRDEVTRYMTNPIARDTDGGSVEDGDEIYANGTDPLDPSDDVPADAVDAVDPWAGAHVQGGVTCQHSPVGSGAGPLATLALALLLLVMGRSQQAGPKRNPVRSTKQGVRTQRSRRPPRTPWILLVALVAPGGADGQGFDTQTLHLTAPGVSILGSHRAETLGQLGYAVGVSSQFSRDSLTIARNGETLRQIVRNRVELTTHVAFGAMDWLDVGLDVPTVLYLDGQQPNDAPVEGRGFGDLRIWVKAQGLHWRRHYVDLGGVVQVGAPTGDVERYLGAGAVTASAELLLGRAIGPVYVGLTAGYRLVPEAQVLDYTQDDRITVSIAASFKREKERLEFHARLFGSALAFAPFERPEQTNLEGLASVSWRPIGGFTIDGGVGFGIMPGAGTPAYRAFLGLGWAAPVAALDLADEDPVNEDPAHEDPIAEEPVDTDGDGIVDEADKCPTEPEDFDGFDDTDGCPDIDNDEDGIADVDDACINDPETPNGFEDEDGCPDEAMVRLDREAGKIEVLNEAVVHFDWMQSEVPDDYLEVLKQVAWVMKSHPEIELLQVEGHTSWTGNHGFNVALSRHRAAAVTGWLMHFGVEPDRVLAKGFGFTRLRIKARGPDANHMNRRVEFVILKGDVSLPKAPAASADP